MKLISSRDQRKRKMKHDASSKDKGSLTTVFQRSNHALCRMVCSRPTKSGVVFQSCLQHLGLHCVSSSKSLREGYSISSIRVPLWSRFARLPLQVSYNSR